MIPQVKKGSDKLIGALSDIGNFRKVNEDHIGHYIDDHKSFYIVADGMGGHNGGEIASSIAVVETMNYMKAANNLSNPSELLREAIIIANQKIYDLSLKDQSLSGMGTTITACLIIEEMCCIANVGDSSCYVLKGEEIVKVTRDHSLVQELIDKGSITENEARSHPYRNIVTRAVGTSLKVNVDIYIRTLSSIDKIILCSDGLTDEVPKEEIKSYIIECKDNMEACRKLIDLVKQRGGRDNISVMIFEGVNEDDRYNTGE
jgi:PPM family protein phosphatase